MCSFHKNTSLISFFSNMIEIARGNTEAATQYFFAVERITNGSDTPFIN